MHTVEIVLLVLLLGALTGIAARDMRAIALPLILRRLPPPDESPTVCEERHARIAACQAAMADLVISDAYVQTHTPEWVAMQHEAMGRLTQEYRNRINLLDDGSGVATSTETRRESPEMVRQRKRRYVAEIELRLKSIQTERHTLYAEHQAHRIYDESLRSLVSELDLQEVSLGKRLKAARRTAGLNVPP